MALGLPGFNRGWKSCDPTFSQTPWLSRHFYFPSPAGEISQSELSEKYHLFTTVGLVVEWLAT